MKKISILIVFVMLCFCITGCSDKFDENNTRIITDINGDLVEIPQEIKSILCRSGNGTSFIVAMGQEDKLVGTADYVLTNPWCKIFSEKVANLPGFGWSPSAEEAYSIGADLVMVADPEVAHDLRKDGLNAICYKQYNETEILESVKLMGELFDKQEFAKKWTDYYLQTDGYLRNKLNYVENSEKPNVYYIYGQSNKGVGRTAGGDSIIQYLIESAGGNFITKDLSNDGPTITEEDAIERNPDVIFISGVYGRELKDTLLNSPEWSEVPAVKEGRIYQMPIGFTSWDFYGVEFPLLKLWTAQKLYPELIDVDIHAETKKFHKEFYNVEFTDNQIYYILNALTPDGNEYEH